MQQMRSNESYVYRKTRNFERKYVAYCKKNMKLQKKIDSVLIQLSINPHDVTLRTHKVVTKRYRDVWSTRVTGDLRIIWKVENGIMRLLILLDLGGHSGSKKVY